MRLDGESRNPNAGRKSLAVRGNPIAVKGKWNEGDKKQHTVEGKNIDVNRKIFKVNRKSDNVSKKGYIVRLKRFVINGLENFSWRF